MLTIEVRTACLNQHVGMCRVGLHLIAAAEYPSLVNLLSLYKLMVLNTPSLSSFRSNSVAKDVGLALSPCATSLSKALMAAKAIHLVCRIKDFNCGCFLMLISSAYFKSFSALINVLRHASSNFSQVWDLHSV